MKDAWSFLTSGPLSLKPYPRAAPASQNARAVVGDVAVELQVLANPATYPGL